MNRSVNNSFSFKTVISVNMGFEKSVHFEMDVNIGSIIPSRGRTRKVCLVLVYYNNYMHRNIECLIVQKRKKQKKINHKTES